MTAPSVHTQILSYKYRLFTSRAQEAALNEMLRDFADLYNAALQQRVEAWQRAGKGLRYLDQAGELKACRLAEPDLARWSFSAEQQVLRRLQRAFDGFFSRMKRGEKPGFPRFRAASRFHSADFRVGDGLTIRKSGRLGVAGILGEIKVKWHRSLPSVPKSAILTRNLGKWYVVFNVEVDCGRERAGDHVGIDVGLSSLAALSTGETINRPGFTKTHEKRLRRLNRSLARKKRFSGKWKQARRALARLHRDIAARRRDHAHKVSAGIARRFAHVAFEDFNIKGLAASMLAKHINDAAWRQLVSFTTYKVACTGGIVLEADARGTSQECPDCGQIAKKTLAQRMHVCDCGCVLDRDVASAIVIRNRAFPETRHGTCRQAPSQRVAA